MISLLSVPYHLGRHGVGMGAGPDRMLTAGAEQVLADLGHQVTVEKVSIPGMFEHEIGAHFKLQADLGEQVRRASADRAFPVVLAGNCSSVLGVVAGLRLGQRGGVIWFDAHGDANTPETTTSGFLDGMPVAVLTGRCWTAIASAIPGFIPLADDHVVLAGVRDIDDDERALLDSSQIAVVPPSDLTDGAPFAEAVSALATRVDSVHVHIDLDVIDLADGHANEFAAAGGPSLDALDAAIAQIGEHCEVNSVSLTSYNPSVDQDGRALQSGMRLLRTLGTLAPTTH